MATPTRKQLTYLRRLAEGTGTTFTPPSTTVEASREIERLKHGPRHARSDVARERRAVSDDLTRRGDAATVRPDEVQGYGSTARWSGGPA
jgi:hypothetical protein